MSFSCRCNWLHPFSTCHQGITKKCRLSLLTNSALVYKSKCGGDWGVAGSQSMSTAVHITWHVAQINFGDLPSYFTYACHAERRNTEWERDRRGVAMMAAFGANASRQQRRGRPYFYLFYAISLVSSHSSRCDEAHHSYTCSDFIRTCSYLRVKN